MDRIQNRLPDVAALGEPIGVAAIENRVARFDRQRGVARDGLPSLREWARTGRAKSETPGMIAPAENTAASSPKVSPATRKASRDWLTK